MSWSEKILPPKLLFRTSTRAGGGDIGRLCICMLWSLLLPTVSSLMASQPAGFPHQEEGKVCAQVLAGCPPGPWCSRQMASAAQGRFQHPGTASSAAPSRELPGSPGCLRTCGPCGQLRSLHAAQRGLLGQARLYCVQPDTWWHNWYRSRRF